MSSQSLIGLATSPSNQPTVVPGVLSLGIGQQFASLLLFPDAKTADPVSAAAAWTVPTVPAMQGQSLYFQAFLVDPLAANPLPAQVTAVRSVAFD
jgi:hypothetical protein